MLAELFLAQYSGFPRLDCSRRRAQPGRAALVSSKRVPEDRDGADIWISGQSKRGDVVVTDDVSTVNAALKHDDARVLILSGLKGTETDPAKVTITNTLTNDKVPITGLGIDDSPWLAMVLASVTVLCALWLLQKRRHKTMIRQRHKAYSGKMA